MTLKSSGKLTLGGAVATEAVAAELNKNPTALITLNDTDVRTLAGIPSGRIRFPLDFYGKSFATILPPISSNSTTLTLTPADVSGYVAGQARVQLTIESGAYLYCTSGSGALIISGFTAGDQISIVNNGYILGCGGNGGGITQLTDAPSVSKYAATAGGPAITTSCDLIIQNNGYIAGGGGGGAVNLTSTTGGGAGGGGAGGGQGGSCFSFPPGPFPGVVQPGGAGGEPGLAGSDGQRGDWYGTFVTVRWSGGGGGGRILPGTGGAGGQRYNTFNDNGKGGGAGGGGGSASESDGGGGYAYMNIGGAGGSAGSAGNNGAYDLPGNYGVTGGGGGGGWGASGGSALNFNFPTTPGGAGGKAIALNGRSATVTNNGTIYGAIS